MFASQLWVGWQTAGILTGNVSVSSRPKPPTSRTSGQLPVDPKSGQAIEGPLGSLGWTLSRAIPLLDANGKTVDWFGVARTSRSASWRSRRFSAAKSWLPWLAWPQSIFAVYSPKGGRLVVAIFVPDIFMPLFLLMIRDAQILVLCYYSAHQEMATFQSLIDEYAASLEALTGNDFQAEVCARLQTFILGFQTVSAKPKGDAGLDAFSHHGERAYCCYGPELSTFKKDKERVQAIVAKFRGDLRRLYELEFNKKTLQHCDNSEMATILPTGRKSSISICWSTGPRAIGFSAPSILQTTNIRS